jgi:hypothetical protein
MSTVKDIAEAIRKLNPREREQLDEMLVSRKLDWVVEQAQAAIRTGTLREMP